jgi:hypothetical protein
MAVIISSLIATFTGLSQYLKEIPGTSGSELFRALYEVNGNMGHKNQYAISLFLMLPFVLYGIYKLKKIWRYL